MTIFVRQKVAPVLEPPGVDPPTNKEQVLEWIINSLLPYLTEEFREHRFLLNNLTRLNMSAFYATSLTTHAVADTEFSITHNLNRIPEIVIWNVDTTAAMIYDSNRAGWTKTALTLKCNQGSVGLTVLVL